MNRKDFLKYLSCFALLPIACSGSVISRVAELHPDKYITDCKDCRRNFECCKVRKPVYPKEREILERFSRDLIFTKENDYFVMENIPCPFLTKDNRCMDAVYKLRPHICRVYYCSDWGLSPAEERAIVERVKREWNYGANVS